MAQCAACGVDHSLGTKPCRDAAIASLQRQLSEAQGRMDGWAIAMRQANHIAVGRRHDYESAGVHSRRHAAQLQQAQEQIGDMAVELTDMRRARDAAIERGVQAYKELETWVGAYLVCSAQACALGGTLAETEIRAEAAGALAEKTERTLARAQRIIGSLHIERACLIQRIAALAPAEAQEAGD